MLGASCLHLSFSFGETLGFEHGTLSFEASVLPLSYVPFYKCQLSQAAPLNRDMSPATLELPHLLRLPLLSVNHHVLLHGWLLRLGANQV